MADHQQIDISAGALAMFERLLRRTHLSGAADLAAVVAEEARAIGAEALVLYVVDYEQEALIPVPSPDAAGREALAIQGTLAGRAYATTSIVGVDSESGRGRRLWLPLLDGTERVGAMELALPEAPDGTGLALCERYAHLVAMLIVSKAAYSDFFERLRRRKPMTGASELVWTLAPPMVLASDAFVLGAMLEPPYDMGGDAFDYALNGDTLHLAVFDAMGHGLAAAGVAAFALSEYRNSRRSGLGLAETYGAIDAAVAEQYPRSRFVTAVLAELDVNSGRLGWISAGHPAPLLLRGSRHVKTLDVTPAPPAGRRLATRAPVEAHESLEPGDMVLLYTDGLTEARRPGGELFSVERLGEFIQREAAGGQGAPETLRRLREAIIGRREGALRDDATALLVEWRRGSERVVTPETV
jgi:Stage II sporulation protein E (SpoIIE)